MKQKKYFIITLLVTMISMWALVPPMPFAGAVGTITDAYSRISDANIQASSSIQFVYNTSSSTPVNGFWRFQFESSAAFDYGNIDNAGLICDNALGSWTASTTYIDDMDAFECHRTGTEKAAGIATTTIYNLINPNTEGTQYITISNYESDGTLREKVKVAVAIIQDVVVTATVDSRLTFTVDATTTPTYDSNIYQCNDNLAAGTQSATSVPFGDIDIDEVYSICQELNVQTNAQDGYTVTVEQDHELLSDSGATINSFRDSPDGTGTTTAEDWVSPNDVLDHYNQYGHFGLFSDDSDLEDGGYLPTLSPYNDFDNGEDGSALFAGLNGTDPMPVMHHDGPTNMYQQNTGMATVMYNIEITALQEAGDYQNTLTYICTPTF